MCKAGLVLGSPIEMNKDVTKWRMKFIDRPGVGKFFEKAHNLIPSTTEVRAGSRPANDLAAAEYRCYAALISIFFSFFCASTDLGRLIFRIPFEKLASIFAVSMPSGSSNDRMKDP